MYIFAHTELTHIHISQNIIVLKWVKPLCSLQDIPLNLCMNRNGTPAEASISWCWNSVFLLQVKSVKNKYSKTNFSSQASTTTHQVCRAHIHPDLTLLSACQNPSWLWRNFCAEIRIPAGCSPQWCLAHISHCHLWRFCLSAPGTLLHSR